MQSFERDLQSHVQEVSELQQQLTRAEDTLRRDRQQMQQRVSACLSLCMLRLEVLLTTGDWATATTDKKRSRAV